MFPSLVRFSIFLFGLFRLRWKRRGKRRPDVTAKEIILFGKRLS